MTQTSVVLILATVVWTTAPRRVRSYALNVSWCSADAAAAPSPGTCLDITVVPCGNFYYLR